MINTAHSIAKEDDEENVEDVTPDGLSKILDDVNDILCDASNSCMINPTVARMSGLSEETNDWPHKHLPKQVNSKTTP